jgi:hypothetical protein
VCEAGQAGFYLESPVHCGEPSSLHLGPPSAAHCILASPSSLNLVVDLAGLAGLAGLAMMLI